MALYDQAFQKGFEIEQGELFRSNDFRNPNTRKIIRLLFSMKKRKFEGEGD